MPSTRATQQHGNDSPEFRIDVQFAEGNAGEELHKKFVSAARSLLLWASIEVGDDTTSSGEAA
jgi:hypothetical protein